MGIEGRRRSTEHTGAEADGNPSSLGCPLCRLGAENGFYAVQTMQEPHFTTREKDINFKTPFHQQFIDDLCTTAAELASATNAKPRPGTA